VADVKPTVNYVGVLQPIKAGDTLPVANGGTSAATASGARTNLGLAIGTDVQAFDTDLSAVAGLSTTGLMVRTGSGTAATRTLTAPAAGITVSNGDGVSGNPTLALANDLAALEALSGTNTIYYRSGVDTWSAVTFSGLTFSGGVLTASGTSYTADESTLTLSSTVFSIKAGGVGTTQLASGAVTEGKLGLTDVTTANVSTSAHGFTPKAPNDTTKFLRGDGTWAVSPGGSGATVAAAPYVYTNAPFANVSALLHFDGTNGSTTITDVIGGTWTAVGGAAINTSQSVFGGASLFVSNGLNQSVKRTNSSAFDVGTGDWSIEFRWRYNGAPQTAARVFATRDGDTNQGIALTVDANSVLAINMSSTGASADLIPSTTVGRLSQTAWNTIIIQRRGIFVETFVNGQLLEVFTIGSASIYYSAGDLIVIGGNSAGTSRSMNAFIDEFRFTKGSYVMVPGDPGLGRRPSPIASAESAWRPASARSQRRTTPQRRPPRRA
jgi:hypothetical protein